MATTAGAKKGLWSTIRRIAASDRISGLIMLGFALTGLVLANLPATAHAFETVAETHLFIPYTNLDLPIGHWAQDGLLTIFFLTVGLELKQELTTGSLANPKTGPPPGLVPKPESGRRADAVRGGRHDRPAHPVPGRHGIVLSDRAW